MEMDTSGATFSETHYQKIRQFTLEVLTILFLGLLLNLIASIIFAWVYNPPVPWSNFQMTFIILIILITSFSIVGMIRLRKPENLLRRTAVCYLLWNINHKMMIESVYDYPTGYNPQQFSWQVYEMIAKHKPELLKGLGREATKEDIKIVTDMLEYLIFFWLGWDALKPTGRLGFKGQRIDIEKVSQYVKKNRIVSEVVRLGKRGWSPPDINIELPEDVSLSVSKSVSTNNEGELAITNQYFSIHIRYRQPLIRSLSSMWMGPAPSIMGMPVNPFYLEQERKPERRLEPSSLRVAFFQIVFEVKFNNWMLHRYGMFYKNMQWAEQLSNLFMEFFDWGRNVEVALEYQKEEIHKTLKEIEARIKVLEDLTGQAHKKDKPS